MESKAKVDVTMVYDKYKDMLYRIALSYLQGDHDAQDAIHDVFVKYLLKAPSFEDEDHEKAWLIRVTINRCHDLLRRQKLRNHASLEEISEVTPDSSHSDVADRVQLMEHLALIPENNRSVIILYYLEGFSVEETANILDLSISAVKMRLRRGREALKKKLGEGESNV